ANAHEFFREFRLQLVDELVLCHSRWPLVKGLQRHEELRVEEACGVASIVGTTVLRDHSAALGVANENLPDPFNHRNAGLQRYGRRHGGADPKIAFLERWQELTAESRADDAAGNDKGQAERNGDRPMFQRPT